MPRGEKSEKITIRLPSQLKEKIDIVVTKGYYRNRTEFIISSIRHSIMLLEKEHPEMFKEEKED